VDGDKVGYRMLRPTIANEPDRDKRQRLERARNELTDEHLNSIYLEAHRRSHEAANELGQPTYLELYRRFGMQLDELGEQCRALLDSTERLWEDIGDRFFRARVGVGLDEAERWDVQRAFRAPAWDAGFPAERMLPALESTLSGLGIDLRKQENVHLDVEQRPLKSPRAFCAPIEVPGKIMLVIQPIGGVDDWRALFHEAGHTEHFAHTSAALAMEERRLGDNAVTEGWAALLERLTSEPAWLNQMLDFPRADEFERESAAEDLYFLRRYCAKFLYELDFHAGADPTDLQPLYLELLSDALKISPSPTDYLADLDPGFYASSYLRSWAFEAQLRDFLRERFGSTWFADRSAGSLLRELWSEGQRMNAEEMLQEVTGAALEMEAVAARIREPLAGAR
jgi:oligoendopeptidase F